MHSTLTIISLLFCTLLHAQESGLTKIKIASATYNELATSAVQTQFENKMKGIFAANNIMEGYGTPFLLIPHYSTNEKTVVEGMQKMTVIKFNMNLEVKNWSSNDVFASESIIITGSGASDNEALKNAISKIKPTDSRIASFLRNVSERISQYYQKECGNLMVQADKQAATKDYASALSILAGIPNTASCSAEANKKTTVYYQKHQEQNCAKYLQKAEVYTAGGNYHDALYYLGQLDREASCIKEADALMTEIGTKVDAQNKKEWEIIMKRQEAANEAGKVRADILDKILENHYREKIVIVGD